MPTPVVWRAGLESRLRRLWFDRHPSGSMVALRRMLMPLSWVVGLVARRRRKRIEAARRTGPSLDPAVVVVGNLVVGGAGKTPIVLSLAKALSTRGWRIGLICRGHGAAERVTPARLVTADLPAREVGDEALLLARSGLPVAAGADRGGALALLVKSHPGLEVVIADDGLQHAGLARSLEIAVFDDRGAGNGRLLPAGPLREPLAHLATMDAVLFNRGFHAVERPPIDHPLRFDSRLRLLGAQPLAAWRSGGTDHGTVDLAALPGGPVAAVAGIAQPERFFSLLRAAGLAVAPYPLADHGSWTPEEFAALSERLILVTEKDAVKCASSDDSRIWVVRIGALPDPAMLAWLEEALGGPKTA